MLNIAPANIFPLKYPKTDLTLPSHGAKVVPVVINYSGDNACAINLLDVQTQKDFDSLRCVWIDTRDCAQSVLVEVAGTGQRFAVPPNTAGYYPLIVLNNPLIVFTVANPTSDSVRVMFLNFVPHYSLQPSSGGGAGGNVTVDNFPAIQDVQVLNKSATEIFSVLVKTGGKAVYFSSKFTMIHGLDVATVNAVKSTMDSVSLSVFSGDGTLVINLAIPVSRTTPAPVANIISLSDMNIPMVNNGTGISIQLSTGLDSGAISCAFAFSEG